MVLVRSHAERIVVLFKDEVVADHPREFRRDQIIYDPWHYLPILVRKPGALRNGAPFKDWDLPAGLAEVRAKLKSHADADRQFIKVLAAVLDHGLPQSRPPVPKRWRRPRQWRCHSDRTGTPTAAGGASQHHHTRCIAFEDRTRG